MATPILVEPGPPADSALVRESHEYNPAVRSLDIEVVRLARGSGATSVSTNARGRFAATSVSVGFPMLSSPKYPMTGLLPVLSRDPQQVPDGAGTHSITATCSFTGRRRRTRPSTPTGLSSPSPSCLLRMSGTHLKVWTRMYLTSRAGWSSCSQHRQLDVSARR